jgi:hypothetical protein
VLLDPVSHLSKSLIWISRCCFRPAGPFEWGLTGLRLPAERVVAAELFVE